MFQKNGIEIDEIVFDLETMVYSLSVRYQVLVYALIKSLTIKAHELLKIIMIDFCFCILFSLLIMYAFRIVDDNSFKLISTFTKPYHLKYVE